MSSDGKGNKGRAQEPISPSPHNVGRPQQTLRYDDSAAVGKTYVPMSKKRQQIKASDSPFEPEVVRHLIGKADPEKAKIFVEESAVSFPMTDERGRRGTATGHFLLYTSGGKSALITPGGEIETHPVRAKMRKDMAPGMMPGKGPYEPRSIPPDQMTQPAWKFSYFSPWKTDDKA